ncbi:MAG TPA: O-antigen ligase family protein [Casimicrobiaceae bacterium]|nr:O-antigen ligase family protein [Casimicrobiaceae bacterium]
MAGLTERHRSALATLVCAIAIFLATADQAFGTRLLGINLRVANVILGLALVAWLVRHRGPRNEVSSLLVAWTPFIIVFALAALLSPHPALGAVKLGWFAFNFFAAYAFVCLFRPTESTRGFFAAFVAVSAIVAIDFLIGFTRGPSAMIGFGQPNDLVPGTILYRPHAFYYEPSYAASGIALAWALALTRMAVVAPALATVLVGLGLVALAATLSRTGWLYAVVTAIALLILSRRAAIDALREHRKRVIAALAIIVAVAITMLAPEANRARASALLRTLGVSQTFERICPIVRDTFSASLACLSDEARKRVMTRPSDIVPEQTGEGQRITQLRESVARIAANPLLGHGVTPGRTRLIEPVTSNVWLEIATEGGLLSATAFAFGLVMTMIRWRAFEGPNRSIAVALILYFVVAWPFLQTFPRLDTWVALWIALAFAARQPFASSQTASASTGAPSSNTRA